MSAKLDFWNEAEFKKLVRDWPTPVRKAFGKALREVQEGQTPSSHAKPLKGFDVALWELFHRSGARVIYTVAFVKIDGCVHVIDAFNKDSKEGRKMRNDVRERIISRVARLKKTTKNNQKLH